MQQKAIEKIDPLTRIQEEIKEVVRREEEYRQLTSAQAMVKTVAITETHDDDNHNDNDKYDDVDGDGDVDVDGVNEIVVTAKPATIQCTPRTTLLAVPPIIEDNSSSNTPSLTSSVNSSSSSSTNKEESLDEQHSDDSGISASSTLLPITKAKHQNDQPLRLHIMSSSATTTTTTTTATTLTTTRNVMEQRYIGPNCYNLTPEPPQQKLMTRTISTPQLNGGVQARRQFAFNGVTKGVMQRFIASHGKVQLVGGGGGGNLVSPVLLATNSPVPQLKLNARYAQAFLETGSGSGATTIAAVAATTTSSATNSSGIERDSEGRPLRRGYVPVEQKIQRELQDLKSRETELKRLRKLNRKTLDKLQLSTDDDHDDDDENENENGDAIDGDNSDVEEHCYGPGQLRNTQSSLELDSTELEQNYKIYNNNRSNGNGEIRPALSLAQLCDLTPEEAPSSHRLIAQWESIIKKNADNSGVPIEASI